MNEPSIGNFKRIKKPTKKIKNQIAKSSLEQEYNRKYQELRTLEDDINHMEKKALIRQSPKPHSMNDWIHKKEDQICFIRNQIEYQYNLSEVPLKSFNTIIDNAMKKLNTLKEKLISHSDSFQPLDDSYQSLDEEPVRDKKYNDIKPPKIDEEYSRTDEKSSGYQKRLGIMQKQHKNFDILSDIVSTERDILEKVGNKPNERFLNTPKGTTFENLTTSSKPGLKSRQINLPSSLTTGNQADYQKRSQYYRRSMENLHSGVTMDSMPNQKNDSPERFLQR